MSLLKQSLVLFVCLGLADALWFSYSLGAVYAPLMGEMLRTSVEWPAAIGFYVLYAVGLSYFVLGPALKSQESAMTRALKAAFFGLIAFSTYDLTAMAVIDGWSWPLSLIDMAWGMFNSALAVSLSGFFLTRNKGALSA